MFPFLTDLQTKPNGKRNQNSLFEDSECGVPVAGHSEASEVFIHLQKNTLQSLTYMYYQITGKNLQITCTHVTLHW
jgi:hypothetical protein